MSIDAENPYQSPGRSAGQPLVFSADGALEVRSMLVEDDALAFGDYFHSRSDSHRRQLLFIRIAPSLILFLLAVFYLLTTKLQIFSVPLLFGGLFFLIFGPHFVKWRMRKALLKVIREGQNLSVLGDQRIVITPKEIVRFHSYGHSATYWPAIEGIEMGTEHLFVFVSANSAFIMPFRDFARKDDIKLFFETMQKYHQQAV